MSTGVDGRRRRERRTTGEPADETPPAHGPAERISGGATRDREQPCVGGGVATVGAEGADGPQVGVLGDVVGEVPPHHVGAQAPHLGLGTADERSERDTVSVTGRERRPR